MIIKRNISFFIIFILITLFSGFFIGNYFKDSQRDQLEASHEDFHDLLGLTEEQLLKLEPIEAKFTEEKAYHKDQLHKANRALGDIMLKEKSFTPEVQKAVEKVHNAMGELQNVTLIHFFDMRAILDENQARIFDDYAANVMYGLN